MIEVKNIEQIEAINSSSRSNQETEKISHSELVKLAQIYETLESPIIDMWLMIGNVLLASQEATKKTEN